MGLSDYPIYHTHGGTDASECTTCRSSMANSEKSPFDITFGEYQETARTTAIYPEQYAVIYPALGLAGEAGEVANKAKKMLRDGLDLSEVREALVSELGDVLWYISQVAYDLGIGLDYVANENLDKLLDRKQRGVLGGSGDKR